MPPGKHTRKNLERGPSWQRDVERRGLRKRGEGKAGVFVYAIPTVTTPLAI
jgi:hypothetical protein